MELKIRIKRNVTELRVHAVNMSRQILQQLDRTSDHSKYFFDNWEFVGRIEGWVVEGRNPSNNYYQNEYVLVMLDLGSTQEFKLWRSGCINEFVWEELRETLPKLVIH